VSVILITGGSGFLGSYLARGLADTGAELVTTHFHEPRRAAVGAPPTAARPEALDIRDGAAVRRLIERIRPDVVYHFAGQAYVVPSWDDPAGTFDVNLSGTLHLLEALRRVQPRCRVVFAGSGTEYGEPTEVPTPETAALRPTSPYAASKAAADLLCFQYFASFGLPVLRLRIFGTTGIGKRGDVCNDFASQVAAIESRDDDARMRVGALDRVRDLLDVRDAVRGMIRVADRGAPGEAYNIGRGTGVEIREVLDRLVEMARRRITVEPDDQRLRRVDEAAHVAEVSRLRRLGWTPEIPLEETLREILGDWRTRQPTALAATPP